MMFRDPPAQRRGVFNSTTVAAATIILLNAYLARGLFQVTYTEHLNSIEGAFISIARFVSANWADFRWWPLWHSGMPFEHTYVPGLHITVAAFRTLTQLDAARAYHIVTAFTYTLGPLALFYLVRTMRGTTVEAFLTALVYSLFSPSALLIKIIRDDMHSVYHARRFQVLTMYGEGPHITALTLIPLVIATLQRFHDKRTPWRFAFAACAWCALVLVNQPGTVAGLVIAYCWVVLHAGADFRRAVLECASTALTGLALALFALPPSAIVNTLRNVGPMHRAFSLNREHVLLLAAVAAVPVALNYILLIWNLPLRWRFGAITSAMLMIIVLTADSQHFELLPQCGRYHVEMEMALCILAGAALYGLMPRWHLARVVFVCLLIAAGIHQVRRYSHYMTFMARPIDITARSEYLSARWVHEHLPGRRVYATGSTAFWLNVFSDTPQLTGCCDQSMSATGQFAENIPYLVNLAASPVQIELSRKWLEAYGVAAVIANTPASTEEYKDFRNGEKFTGVLPVLYRGAGDIIYAVPLPSESLAHAILPQEAITAMPAVLEDPALERYLGGIERADRPHVRVQWISNSRIQLDGELAQGQLLSLQVAYARGWSATVNHQRREISADGLGNMLITPECSGACTVDLVYTGPPDKPLAMACSGAVFLMLCVAVFRPQRKRDAVEIAAAEKDRRGSALIEG